MSGSQHHSQSHSLTRRRCWSVPFASFVCHEIVYFEHRLHGMEIVLLDISVRGFEIRGHLSGARTDLWQTKLAYRYLLHGCFLFVVATLLRFFVAMEQRHV